MPNVFEQWTTAKWGNVSGPFELQRGQDCRAFGIERQLVHDKRRCQARAAFDSDDVTYCE
jgi:hypothetical protein